MGCLNREPNRLVQPAIGNYQSPTPASIGVSGLVPNSDSGSCDNCAGTIRDLAPETRSELVLGLPRTAVPGGLDWRGVSGAALDPYLAAVAEHGTFRPRDEVEDDPSWKQIIPYLCCATASASS